MAIGRPISLTPNIATKNISSLATADQTQFTVTGGYRINEIAVYRNGVRLAEGRDFTASDGDTVNLVTAATVDDVIEFAIFDSFNVSDAIVSVASSQNVNGDLNVTGNLYAGSFIPTELVVGVVTANSALHAGTALTANAAGDVETIGIITASTFSGDGNLDLVTANELQIGLGVTIGYSGVTTITNGVSQIFFGFQGGTTAPRISLRNAANSVGGQIQQNVLNGDMTLSSDGDVEILSGSSLKCTDTTESTSTGTGALIVSGGVGIAKSLRVGNELHVGGDVSIGGTLTYEDVTNVDSVGLITAKSGVNVSGGELNVGLAYSVGNAGVVTAQNVTISAGTIDLKNSGSVSNIKFYCESSNAHYTALQSAAHSAYGGNVTVTLPTTTDTLVARTTTDTLTNKTLTSPTINTLSGDTASFSSNLTVGSGITFGSAGVATFSGTSDVHLTNAVELQLGDSKDLKLYHNASGNNWMYSSTSAQDLYIGANAGEIYFQTGASANDTAIKIVSDSFVELRYDNNWKLQTTNDGIYVNGIGTASRSYVNTPSVREDDNIPLLVKGIVREDPVIGIQGKSSNGVTLIGDAYVDGESQFTLGLHYSGCALVLGQVGVSTDTNNAYVSIQDAYAHRPGAMVIDDGAIKFRNDSADGIRPVGTAVTMYDRMTIENSGRVLIGDSSTYAASGDLHIVGDTNSNGPELYLQVGNNNTTDNIGALYWGNNADKTLNRIAGHTKLANNTSYLTFSTSKAGTLATKLELNNDGAIITGIATITSTGVVNAMMIQGIGSHELYSYHDSGGAGWATGAGAGNYGELLYFDESNGNVHIYAEGEQCANFKGNGEVNLFYDNVKKFETTNDGTVTTGIGTFTAGANFDGILSEKYNETAGKLSDNTNIDLEDGMIHFFTTTETTTSTPNIRYNSSKSLNNMMNIGDSLSVTVITSAAAAGYSANWNVDGSGVTEEWNGGSAPSAGGSGGYDVYTITLLKRSNASFTALANVSNFA